MILGSVLEKSIGYNKSRISSHGCPFSIKNVIFDLGKNVKYDYLIVVAYTLRKYICREDVVFFNKEMSFDLYESLNTESYFDELERLFNEGKNNDGALFGHLINNTFDFDSLLNYMKTHIEMPIGPYESVNVFFKLNNYGTYEHIKTLYKIN